MLEFMSCGEGSRADIHDVSNNDFLSLDDS